jgi:hypothetical protein
VRAAIVIVLGLLLAACTGTSGDGGTSPSTTVAGSGATPSAAALPDGLPPGYEDDVGPGEVPSAALIPLTGRVIGRWDAATPDGDAIVVAWTMPGDDPFAAPGGVATWKRFADGGSPWRPTWATTWRARDGVLGVDGEIADLTGDGSPDALLRIGRGGSGACADVRAVELATGAPAFVRDGLCDATIAPGDPGLVITEAVFAPGDAHCCPSRLRTSELAYAGSGEWVVTDETLTDL